VLLLLLLLCSSLRKAHPPSPTQTRVSACFMEAMRLQPPIVVIPKFAMADVIVPTSPLEDGTPADNLFIPQYSEVFLDAMALHRNRMYPRYVSFISSAC
jgi:hypothetical protein